MDQREPAHQAQDAERMLQMITGYWITQIIHAAAVHSFADHLAKGPATAGEIARAAGTHAEATFRLLRACTSIGLVTCDGGTGGEGTGGEGTGGGGERFAATPLLDTLRRDRPGSLRGMAIAQASPGHWLAWGRFPQAVRTGERQAVPALGAELFDYYAANPAEAGAFTDAMSGLTAMVAAEAARVIDTAGIGIAADIGGAAGALLHALLRANPGLAGIVLDRPNVVPDAVAAAERAGLGRRVRAVGGDFFEAVPAADLYLVKFILHDWDDDACSRILRSIARAIRPGGRVVVIEMLLGAVGDPDPRGPLMDLNMMVLAPGRERTLAEFQHLFAASGLGFTRVIPANGPMAFIEAVKA